MSNEAWRPLGVDTEEEISTYDALHDGVPAWMTTSFWAWIKDALTKIRRYGDGSGRVPMLDTELAEEMCQRLQIAFPNLRRKGVDPRAGQNQLQAALEVLIKYPKPLQIADYLLANGGHAEHGILDTLLEHSKSVWEVGTRLERPGLVRRVPLGVQTAADDVIGRAGRAGSRLAKAWEELYGLVPDASSAYRFAIMAVEDAAIPVVSPKNPRASLGTVLSQMESQGDWCLPMDREHPNAPSSDVLVGMMRMLWHGQHDRHGGQPSAPGNVSVKEAIVAVATAVTLVHWFDAGIVNQKP